MHEVLPIVLHLILLHTVDGRETYVNPKQIASISSAVEGEKNKLLIETVHCVIGLTNGKIISVKEHCDEVVQKLEEVK
jgi:uncharacterized protein YlzI (FlbEa/FlbD family)